ncbi:CDP-alcohol phosphatidyltransferase family protein [Fulvivirga sp. 29W222]|uniref:CDP-alcohol phosphatidyltransferase family protein n=1 Tax=Fulvivirga marina TaxID=2494733 RepID=A0A937KCP4_9BACT|nr:CDP-alcohol phosphatidyltransferase family protein [Fulvivirga marina]MBL6445190.1 CDP-alcohol phosphatidyltransferase family protein [Fulvivirga marina]
MKNYTYRQNDKSLLSKAFVTLLTPISSLVPPKLPANYLSIISHLSIYVALYVSYANSHLGDAGFIIIPILLLLHLITDKLDGVQARATRTASALGEFMDHYFEIFNQGVLVLVIWNLFSIKHEWIVLLVLTSLVLLKMTRFYEQYKANILVKGVFEAFEFKMLLAVGLLFCNSSSIYTFVETFDFQGLLLVELVLLFVSAGAIINSILTIIRVPHLTYGYWMFMGFLFLVSVLSFYSMDPLLAAIIILFYGGVYIGKLLMAQLVDGVERSPGLFAPIILAVGFFTAYLNVMDIFFILFLYLLVNILLLIIKTFRTLKAEWYWSNPEQPEE